MKKKKGKVEVVSVTKQIKDLNQKVKSNNDWVSNAVVNIREEMSAGASDLSNQIAEQISNTLSGISETFTVVRREANVFSLKLSVRIDRLEEDLKKLSDWRVNVQQDLRDDFAAVVKDMTELNNRVDKILKDQDAIKEDNAAGVVWRVRESNMIVDGVLQYEVYCEGKEVRYQGNEFVCAFLYFTCTTKESAEELRDSLMSLGHPNLRCE